MKRSYMPPKPLKRKRAASKPKRASGGKIGAKKTKIWSLKKADKVFSKQIRARDGKCMHPHCVCGSKKLQCSHYIGRVTKSTRFDPDNCITLGWRCHFKDKLIGFEYQKQRKEKHGFDGQYTIFMQQWLGPERWQALLARAQTSIKQNAAIASLMALQEKE